MIDLFGGEDEVEEQPQPVQNLDDDDLLSGGMVNNNP